VAQRAACPAGLPVGVVGAIPTSVAVTRGYETHPYASAADARTAIRDRHVHGAFVGRKTYIATAASPAVAQRLRQVVPGNTVTDLAPGTRHDPQAATVTLADALSVCRYFRNDRTPKR
jgi:hypothetical protein